MFVPRIVPSLPNWLLALLLLAAMAATFAALGEPDPDVVTFAG